MNFLRAAGPNVMCEEIKTNPVTVLSLEIWRPINRELFDGAQRPARNRGRPSTCGRL